MIYILQKIKFDSQKYTTRRLEWDGINRKQNPILLKIDPFSAFFVLIMYAALHLFVHFSESVWIRLSECSAI